MITQSYDKFNDCMKRRTVYRDERSNRTAAIRFGDALRSTRSTSGIHYESRSILWSESVLQQADADGVKTLETVITDKRGNVTTYRCTLAAMLERGELQRTPAGTQRGLALDAWTTSRRGAVTPSTPTASTAEPTPAPQMTLFAEAAR
jgi:hypothetical protein